MRLLRAGGAPVAQRNKAPWWGRLGYRGRETRHPALGVLAGTLRADTHGGSVRVHGLPDFRAALAADREGHVGVAGRLGRLAAIDVFGADGAAGFAGRAVV